MVVVGSTTWADIIQSLNYYKLDVISPAISGLDADNYCKIVGSIVGFTRNYLRSAWNC